MLNDRTYFLMFCDILIIIYEITLKTELIIISIVKGWISKSKIEYYNFDLEKSFEKFCHLPYPFRFFILDLNGDSN